MKVSPTLSLGGKGFEGSELTCGSKEATSGHQAGGYLNHSEQENKQLLEYFQGQCTKDAHPDT